MKNIDRRCPCKQDCPRRSAFCRLSCEEFLKYDAVKKAEYEKKRMKKEAYLLLCDGSNKAIAQIQRQTKRRSKP